MMARESEDYHFWRAALRGEKQSVQESNPQCGFYKIRISKSGPWRPVAIWKAGNKTIGAFEGGIIDPVESWTYACKNPVTEEAYRFHIERGRWPDEVEAAPIGHNMPEDPFDALMVEVNDRLERAQSFLGKTPKTPTEIDANLARNLQAEVLALNKRATAMFEGEKKPIVEAGRAIDERYRFRTAIADISTRLRGVFEAYMKAEEARQRAEAQAKFEAERKRIAEERARAEEERQRLEREDPIMAAITPVEALPEAPRAPEPVKITVGGGVGRRTALKTVLEPVIDDYAAALQHYANHPDVRAVIDKLVRAETRLHKDQTSIPGVRVELDRRAA